MGTEGSDLPKGQPAVLDSGPRGRTRHPAHRSIGAWSHGIIDYLMVIILVIGPAVAGFAGRQATLAYVLAGVLFALTLLTRFPLGVIKVVRLPTHGAIECVLALMLIVLPWLANFARGIHSRNFYVLIGALMLFLWFLTDFRGVRDRSTAPPAL